MFGTYETCKIQGLGYWSIEHTCTIELINWSAIQYNFILRIFIIVFNSVIYAIDSVDDRKKLNLLY